MKLDREKIHRLLYETDHQRRFTLDNPIQADVWERFLLLGQERQRRLAERPKASVTQPRVSLLLTPKLTRGRDNEAPGSAAFVAEALRRRVLGLAPGVPRLQTTSEADNQALAAMRIAATEQYVAVDLTFRELIDLLVPLTDWWWRTENRELRDCAKRPGQWPKQPSAKRFLVLATLAERLLSKEPAAQDELEQLFQFFEPSQQEEFPEFGATPRQRGIRQRQTVPTLPPIALPEDFWASSDTLRMRLGPAEQTPAVPRIWSIARNPRAAPVSLGPGFQGQKTVKADAARLLFNIKTAHLTWAIVDSGIDHSHPAFMKDPDQKTAGRRGKTRATPPAHRVLDRIDFTKLRRLLSEEVSPKSLSPAKRESLLSIRRRNENGRPLDWALIEPLIREPKPDPPKSLHGTHVAGILAGNMPDGPTPGEPEDGLMGICPDINLLDLKVFPEPNEEDADPGDGFAIIAALEYLDWLNRDRSKPIVHGVNLSVSVPHRVDAHACGRTPVCQAAERLVNNGTVVVAAAGNAGFEAGISNTSLGNGYQDVSITDPGNAEAVITVGATHRSEPHTYGVSYFSSRGPTGDGRRKPDLVAPGEKILSAAPGGGVELQDGTSMAAPHVSGVAALLMARYPELIGQPRRIKEILMATATDLGRERDFQGAGLVDALRALQSV